MTKSLVNTVGRRKEAIARVRLSAGKGQITVNGKPITEYFPGIIFQKIYQSPLEITKTFSQFAISAKVTGGGKIAQLGAVVHGMVRAIAETQPTLRPVLKKAGLLTRDARVKERRKYGNAQKARAKKQSPKR
ncbi:30S ribosomal protein S9 [Candidatus Daviesbacteria bacterium]|nr:30S ribosomal protein S9 [Candidatus Daviesbacteria bacterium]